MTHCSLFEENIDHFMTCSKYGKVAWEINWKEIFLNNVKNLNFVEKEVKQRQFIRNKKLQEVGLPPLMAPLLHIDVEQE